MVSTRNQEPTFDSSVDAQNKSLRILILKKKNNVPRITGLDFGSQLGAQEAIERAGCYVQKSGKADFSDMLSYNHFPH